MIHQGRMDNTINIGGAAAVDSMMTASGSNN
jgi:hypothetical protein